MTRAPLLVLRMGLTAAEVRARRGNYEHYIAELLKHLEAPLVVADAVAGELPDPAKYGAVIVTGGPSSVHDREPWSEAAAAWLRAAIPAVPTLGICYGHQLMSHALGGRTAPRPGGPELGVYGIEVIEDDPLFDGFARTFPAYQIHWDQVIDKPPGSRLLARSDGSELQVFAHAPRARSVQFHPEYDEDLVRAAVLRHGARLKPPRPNWVAAQHDAVRELPDQRRIITNFLKHFSDVR